MLEEPATKAFFQNLEMYFFLILGISKVTRIDDFYTNFVTVSLKSRTVLKPALYIVVLFTKQKKLYILENGTTALKEYPRTEPAKISRTCQNQPNPEPKFRSLPNLYACLS